MQKKLYSIKDVEALTNIKAHTIRIWELRYNILEPDRTKGNSRRYSDQQLKKIMNVAFLNQHGIKISHIASMSDDQIAGKVKTIGQDDVVTHTYVINQLVSAVVKQDETMLEKLFKQSVDIYGLEETINDIVKPVFEKIGLLWQTGTLDITQEHFLSNYVRAKIIYATEKLPKPTKPITFVLFLPSHELHELGLLFYHYLLREMGFHVIYLGQSVPMVDLVKYHHIKQFDAILTIRTNFVLESELQEFVNELARTFELKKVFLSGMQFGTKNITFPSNSFYFQDSKQFKALVNANI